MMRRLATLLKTTAAVLALTLAAAPAVLAPEPAMAQQVRRGDRLPDEYRGSMVSDYDRYRLRRPPSGYAWYRVGQYFVMASTSTGVIFDIVPVDG